MKSTILRDHWIPVGFARTVEVLAGYFNQAAEGGGVYMPLVVGERVWVLRKTQVAVEVEVPDPPSETDPSAP